MHTIDKTGGFTLFEVLIYIGLFSFIIGGAMLGAYQIFETSGKTNVKNLINEETNFIMRKIDWALSNGISITEFSVDADGSMTYDGDKLTVSGLTVSDFYVETVGDKVSFSFWINGRQSATSTRYARF